jgi:hypothetical protein
MQNDARTDHVVHQTHFTLSLCCSGCVVCDIILQHIEAKQNKICQNFLLHSVSGCLKTNHRKGGI